VYSCFGIFFTSLPSGLDAIHQPLEDEKQRAAQGKVLQDSTRRDGSRLLGPGQAWGRVIFICTPAFEAKLRKDLEAAGWTRQQVDALSSFESALYRFEDTLFPQK
jgi:hypothetical protein